MNNNTAIKYFDKHVECMPRKKLEKLQLKKLKKTVEYVFENCPVYRDKMIKAGVKPTDIKTIADLTKLPFTEKEDLRANYPFNMFSAKRQDIVRIHTSSGTTGKLTVVGYTKKDIQNWTYMVTRALVGIGCNSHDIIQVAYGYGLFTGGLGLHYGIENLGATVVPISTGNTRRQLELICDFNSTVLCCTPSYALYIAEEMKELKVTKKDLSLKKGIFAAEFWNNAMRKHIESELGIDAYDFYGLSEIMGPGVASECVYKKGLHISEDFFLPEIIDADSLEQLPDGQQGELVITTINKQGIPLIRYRTHDLTSITHEQCECGRTFARISKIVGRTDDMIIIRGVNIYPSQIESVLLKYKDNLTLNYQIKIDRINNLDVMQVDVELNNRSQKLEQEELVCLNKQLSADIKSAISTSAKIVFVKTGNLEQGENKQKKVIDKREF